MGLSVVFYSCGTSKPEETTDDTDGFTAGSEPTVVTGANLTGVSTNCTHSDDETSNFQSLECKLLIKNSEEDSGKSTQELTSLLYDDFLAVTAVEGVEVSWGVPPDLNFNCSRVRQATELYCFRESDEVIEDFSVLLSVIDMAAPSNTFVVTSTAVSSSVNQSSAPDAPSSLNAVTSSSVQIDLSYVDNSTNETGFSIERSLDEVSWTSIGSVASGIVTYASTSLSPSVQYFYRVRACNSVGCSAYSNTANATTDATGSSSHIIFVTSTTHFGNLGGLSGADLICSNRATAGSLTGTWKAILSAPSVNAVDRIVKNGEIRNTNDGVVAQDSAQGTTDFWSGTIVNPIAYDEFGNAQTGYVWTGSVSGGAGGGLYCVNWNNPVGQGGVGTAEASNLQWLRANDDFCTNAHRLYCINGQ